MAELPTCMVRLRSSCAACARCPRRCPGAQLPLSRSHPPASPRRAHRGNDTPPPHTCPRRDRRARLAAARRAAEHYTFEDMAATLWHASSATSLALRLPYDHSEMIHRIRGKGREIGALSHSSYAISWGYRCWFLVAGGSMMPQPTTGRSAAADQKIRLADSRSMVPESMLEQADVAQSVRFFKRNTRTKAHLYSQDTTGRKEVSVPVHGAQARSKIACDTPPLGIFVRYPTPLSVSGSVSARNEQQQ